MFAGVAPLPKPLRPVGCRCRPLSRWPRQQRPAPWLCHWLQDRGSLTARLVALSRGEFRVRVLRQQHRLPSLDEQLALGLKRPGLALVREVVLEGRGQPWVFARSVLPLSSLTGQLRQLRRQGSRPLGAFLFSQPRLVRSPIQVVRLGSGQAYVPAACLPAAPDQPPLWGRRSVFWLQGKPLLVSEVFLPSFAQPWVDSTTAAS